MAFIKPFSRSHRPNDPGYAVDVPADWEDAAPLTRLWFYASAIKDMGPPFLFSLLLTHPTRTQMEESRAKPKDFIAQRFRNYLPGVPFFFVLEHTTNDVIHLLGCVSTSDIAPSDLRACLKKVAWDRRKLTTKEELIWYDRRAVDLKTPNQGKNQDGRNAIFGWICYSAKHLKKTERRLGCSPISCSRDVSQRARQIHAEVADLTPDMTRWKPDVSPPVTKS